MPGFYFYSIFTSLIIKTAKVMYSLDCSYYEAQWNSIGDLVAHVLLSGMDPNYEITFEGKGTGQMVTDFI